MTCTHNVASCLYTWPEVRRKVAAYYYVHIMDCYRYPKPSVVAMWGVVMCKLWSCKVSKICMVLINVAGNTWNQTFCWPNVVQWWPTTIRDEHARWEVLCPEAYACCQHIKSLFSLSKNLHVYSETERTINLIFESPGYINSLLSFDILGIIHCIAIICEFITKCSDSPPPSLAHIFTLLNVQ